MMSLAAIEAEMARIDAAFCQSDKIKLLCLSTTANVNNPDLCFAALRETADTIAGSILFRDLTWLDKIIGHFDGTVACFLIDCEVKNEVKDLRQQACQRISKSGICIYKPNDITVDALDMWLAAKIPHLAAAKVVIAGAGNIGVKIALKLVERGAQVVLCGRRSDKLATIASAIALIKRGAGEITFSTSLAQSAVDADILLGCTPGVPAIDDTAINAMKAAGMVVDVGNGTIAVSGLRAAAKRDIAVYCLSFAGGYAGFIANWLTTKSNLQKVKKKRLASGVTILTPGLIGGYGDIIVDDVDQVHRVIGVCNGKGDVLPFAEARDFINRFHHTEKL